MSNNDVQTVNPWVANCSDQGFNYDKLVKDFGLQLVTPQIIERFESITGHKAHVWLRRGIFFAHRDLELLLDHYQAGKQIFIYTGRGPSSKSLHLGHLVPLMFTKWLQDVFNAILIIQIADDEKYYFKNIEFDEVYKLGIENAKDIIACGFDPHKTFIFSNHEYSKQKCVQDIIFKMKRDIRCKDIQAIFDFNSVVTLGQLEWPLYQSAAAFSQFYESIFKNQDVMCIVPCAVDQDPYFRLSRDLATKYNYKKPCSIMSQFLPSLEGNAKMNSTNTNNTKLSRTIFVSDDPKTIANNIKRYAFSGGRQTKEEHMRLGADLSVDIPYKYLRYFLDDDDELNRIGDEYKKGTMMTSEIKQILSNLLIDLITSHQEKRKLITDEILYRFYDIEKFNI